MARPSTVTPTNPARPSHTRAPAVRPKTSVRKADTAQLSGRRPKLPEGAEQRFLAAVRCGVNPKHAAAYARIPAHVYARWAARGESDLDEGSQSAYAEFVGRQHMEEATATCQLTAAIFYAAVVLRDWRAAMWLLQRRFPESYGGPKIMRRRQRRQNPVEAFGIVSLAGIASEPRPRTR